MGHHGALDVLVGRAVRGVEPFEGGDGLSGGGVRGEDDVGGGEDDVAMADAGEPPVFTVQTPAWETTVAAAVREAEGV